jgi:DNA-binding CsgD family transcriptional regulator/PAS domain-containing protein
MGFSGKRADKLLDLIYDAATERELWHTVLGEIADVTDSQCGVLFGQSLRKGEDLHFAYNGRCDPQYNEIYGTRHMRNPWSLLMWDKPVGQVVFSDEIYDLKDLRRTAFFDEVLLPQDSHHNAMIPLAAKDDFRAAFNICRSARQGPFGEEERKILAWLVPHLCRSIRLGFRIEAYRALQSAETQVLDRICEGIVLLDRNERIVYANAAALKQGTNGGALRLRNGAISTWSPTHSQQLAAMIGAAMRGAAASAMSVPRPQDGQLVTLIVSSVRGRDVGRFADVDMPDATVLLLIIDPANRAGIPVAWIADAYGLTPGEARVALAAASGGSIPEMARSLNLSPNTVKTHLRKVFAKTGTSRQAELTRLITSIGLFKADTSGAPTSNGSK